MNTRTLIITEKPSVARAIAAALGANVRGDGCIHGNNLIVSWCYGHLIELASPAAYDEKLAKWRREDLPILPDPWQTVVMRDKRQQFEVLRGLMQRKDVCEVVNACDAGREGELIFRLVYEKAGCTKVVKRLWLSSMEPDEIRKAYANMRPGTEYDNLYAAALCRAKADWLVGMNATRLMSLVYHRTLNVGRVVSPTLSMLVERKREIEDFQPEAFYTVAVNCGVVFLSSERIADKSEAEALANDCTGEARIIRVGHEKCSKRAPELYDLTTLQREANRELGFTAQQTLDYLQSLYEKRFVTYPRTDSRYLTDGMAATVPGLVNVAAKLLDVEAPASINAEHVCDSSKVTDHHAVVPTASAVSTNLSALPEGEAAVLRLVCRQLLCAVSEPFTYAETTVEAECSGHTFRTRGKTIIDLGWREYKGAPEWSPMPELTEDAFLADIEHMVSGLVSDYVPVAEASVLFPTGCAVVGKCPSCGGVVSEAKSGYFCEGLDCKFGLWRDNKFLAAKRISLTRDLATELLFKGRAHLDEIYSQRMDKYYPGDLILHDDGERATYYLSFKGGKS